MNSKKLFNVSLNILGSAILAFGVYSFIAPFAIVVGGATGITLIFYRLFGINVSTLALIINMTMLPLGLIFSGKKLVLGSILSSIAYPAAMFVFEHFPSLTLIADSTLIAVICGGICCGFGIGLVMKSGGSTGGIDIPMILIHNKTGVPVSTLIKICDCIIMFCQISFMGLNSIVYGLIYTYIMTQMIEHVLTVGEDCIKLSIISEKYNDIRIALIENDFGVTTIQAKSGYSSIDFMKLESIMTSAYYKKAQCVIESVDPEAFYTIENVKSVRGRGFTMERIPLERDYKA